MSHIEFLRLMHMPTGMAPRVDFVRRALALLDTFEKGFPSQEKEKIAQAEQEAVEMRECLEAQRIDVDAFLKSNMWELRAVHRISLPLDARYSALIFAIVGMESLVLFQDGVRRRKADKPDRRTRTAVNPLPANRAKIAPDALGMFGGG